MRDEELAAFQAVLLDLLYQYETAEEIAAALRRSQACQPFAEWIDQMNPALLETGAELVKKWAVLSED